MAKVWSNSSACISANRPIQDYHSLRIVAPIDARRLQPFPVISLASGSCFLPSLSISCTLSVRSFRKVAHESSEFFGRKSPQNLQKHKCEPCFRGQVFASLPTTGSGSVEMATVLFTFATTLVIPIYTVMILAPHWEWTKKLVESNVPYIVLGGLYVYLLHGSWTSETLQLIFATKHYLPELSGISKMFLSTLTVASAWVHLLAGDLFIGRHIFLDGLDHDVETRHSLLLCMIVCPIGLISHMVTKAITLLLRDQKLEHKKL
ncbi:hypothetical protein O6H91_18G058400 [Diphasiastrum complanatum]|uniref:Uncharacterized protein n=2 Tax=Diphasiastrum complanatum TaxID=34168 RepID=A0ACC2B1Q9_DIPCM|nr:hypothetical protein O6H91_18G058400 [Diphasiastrum complanatum]